MREQVIVWRDDFDNIEFVKEYLCSVRSNKAIARLKSGAMVVGYFNLNRSNSQLDFHAEGIAFYSLETIKEFAFLE